MESVRTANASDLARCADLLDAATAEVAGQRGGAQLLEFAPPADVDALAAWLDGGSARRRLFVGEFEGALVGVAAGTIADAVADAVAGGSADRRGRVAWCYVEPQARGVGVGAALVGALTEWFTAQGCRDMEAVALPGDRSTKQLYEASGLKARLLVMHRSLP